MTRPVEIACSLGSGSAERRMARWEALAGRALEASGTQEGGAWQRYAAGVERELAELVALEGECCPFLTFTLRAERGSIHLEVRGPADAAPIVGAFAGAGRPRS